MLVYFPTLYKDELLYSGIARYHKYSGNRTQRQTIQDLFDERNVCATVDLPSHLDRLSRKMESAYGTDELIENHTLYPYYAYYLGYEQREKAKEVMAGGSSEGLIHGLFGLLASRIKSPEYMRWCKACIAEDSELGEPYWHRSHQLPGVVFCPLHKILLNQSRVFVSTREHKFEYVSLSKIVMDESRSIRINSEWSEHLLFIAEQSMRVLEDNLGQTVPSYREYIACFNYLTVGGRFRFDRLIEDFQSFFGAELLQFLNCDLSLGVQDSWLHKLIRVNSEITQPLRHILMIRFINKKTGVHTYRHALEPFGSQPWPCLNKVASHYRSDVVESCVITRCSKTKLPVGTFHCDCGFIYSRRGPDTRPEDKYRIGRIKNFGLIWNKKLDELNQTDLSLRAKGELLGVDPMTVKKYTFSPLTDTATISPTKVAIANKKTKKHIKSQNFQRVDWEHRDDLILLEVKKAVHDLLNPDRPQRITLNAIARQLTDKRLSLKLLKQHHYKLPKTKKYVLRVLETTAQFQVRRLEWAANELKEQEIVFTGWKLLKIAGLNHPLHEEVFNRYQQLLNY